MSSNILPVTQPSTGNGTSIPLSTMGETSPGKIINLSTSVDPNDPSVYNYTISRPHQEQFKSLPSSTRGTNNERLVVLDSVLRSGRYQRRLMENFPEASAGGDEKSAFAAAEADHWHMYAHSCMEGASLDTDSVKIQCTNDTCAWPGISARTTGERQPCTGCSNAATGDAAAEESSTAGGASSTPLTMADLPGMAPQARSLAIWGHVKGTVEEEERNLFDAKRRARLQLAYPESITYERDALLLRPAPGSRLASFVMGTGEPYRQQTDISVLFNSVLNISPRAVASGLGSLMSLMSPFGKKDDGEESAPDHGLNHPDCILPVPGRSQHNHVNNHGHDHDDAQTHDHQPQASAHSHHEHDHGSEAPTNANGEGESSRRRWFGSKKDVASDDIV
ncbi:hypothetical protein IAT38_005370 [Cryptococcus sp. DSM 104549]